MKYAVFSDRGKQYRVYEGQELYLGRMGGVDGKIEFNNVLLYVDGDKVEIGDPVVKGVKIVGKIEGEEKGEKIRVAKYKAKSRHRRVTGHRTVFTRVKIEKISENN